MIGVQCNRGKEPGPGIRFGVPCCIFSKLGFLDLTTMDLSDWLFVLQDCPVFHCRRFNSIPDLCPLDASSSHPVMTDKNVPWEARLSLVENYGSKSRSSKTLDVLRNSPQPVFLSLSWVVLILQEIMSGFECALSASYMCPY